VLELLIAAGLDIRKWGPAIIGACARQGPTSRAAACLLLRSGAQAPTYDLGDQRLERLAALLEEEEEEEETTTATTTMLAAATCAAA
jgi:hypothetical protein